MKPVISIITTSYNQEEYVGTCIESVLKQGYKDWEMIIIDDCSSDYTQKIIKTYIKNNKKIRFVPHKKRWGVEQLYKSYNQALALSKGNFIAILEADDYWPNNKLEKQIKYFNDNEIILSYGDSITVRADGFPIDITTYHGKDKSLFNDPPGSILQKFADFSFNLKPETVMIKKSALLEIGGFQNDPFFIFTDIPTWYALSLKGKFFYKKEILGYYRRHKNSFWVNTAKDTDAMHRSEMQKSFWAFISRNKKTINNLSLSVDKKKLLALQNNALIRKKKNKNFSIFLHTLLFNDSGMLMKAGKDALADKKIGMYPRLIIYFVIFLGPVRNWLLFVLFRIKFFKYKTESIYDLITETF